MFREICHDFCVVSCQGSGVARVWCHTHCSLVGSVVGCRLGIVYFAPHLYHTVPRESKHLGPSVVCVVRVWQGCGTVTTLTAVVWWGVAVFTPHLHHTPTRRPSYHHHPSTTHVWWQCGGHWTEINRDIVSDAHISPAGRTNVREIVIEIVQIKQHMSVYCLAPLQVDCKPT